MEKSEVDGKWYWRKGAQKVVGLTPQGKALNDNFISGENRYRQTTAQSLASNAGVKLSNFDPKDLTEDQVRKELKEIDAELEKFQGRVKLKDPTNKLGSRYQSEDYAKLLERRRKKKAQLDKLTGTKKTRSLLAPPKTEAEKMREKIEKFKTSDPAQEMQDKIELFKQTQRILRNK